MKSNKAYDSVRVNGKNQAPTTSHHDHHWYEVELVQSGAKLFVLSESIGGGHAERGGAALLSLPKDTKNIVGEMGNVKNENFGARPGDFQVLNVPDEYYKTPEQFWDEYNNPGLIKRPPEAIRLFLQRSRHQMS